MNLPEASSLATVAGGGIAVIGGLWYGGRQVSRLVVLANRMLAICEAWDHQTARIDRVETKINTLWEFVLRRGAAEAVIKGLGTMNSPITITDEAKAWMSGLAGPLREAYETRWKDLDDVNLAVAIEREFGDQITKEICIPHNVANAACLLIACAVARGE